MVQRPKEPGAVRPRSTSVVTLLRILTNELERRGWRDDGDTALGLAQFVARKQRLLTDRDITRIVPTSFYAANGITRAQLLDFTNQALLER